jgi:hypothetical protein
MISLGLKGCGPMIYMDFRLGERCLWVMRKGMEIRLGNMREELNGFEMKGAGRGVEWEGFDAVGELERRRRRAEELSLESERFMRKGEGLEWESLARKSLDRNTAKALNRSRRRAAELRLLSLEMERLKLEREGEILDGES